MRGTDFTVVLLARGSSDLLPISLAHLELQTFPAARFEVLIVNEGAAEDSRKLLERYAASAPFRTRVLYCDEGVSARARNMAVENASGDWILFLDDDLLVGPSLVECHAREQERHGGSCALRGRIQQHPQLDPRVLTRRHELRPFSELRDDQPLRFLDWRADNLSLRRQDIVDANGFDEDPNLDGFEDVELAWRIEEKGVRGFYSDKPHAFAWQPTTVELEIARYYDLGYALHALLEKTESDVIRQRYGPFLSPWRARLDSITAPLCGVVAPLFPSTSSAFTRLCWKALRHAAWQGQHDAAIGHPRRLPKSR